MTQPVPGRSCGQIMGAMQQPAERLSGPVTQISCGADGRSGQGNLRAADGLRKTLSKSSLKDMRQGIASHRRHVAPARLLC
jgi:hypothetical protein